MSEKAKRSLFQPDKIQRDPKTGGHKVVRDNPVRILESATQGKLFFAETENKYYIADGVECPEDKFKDHYLPYLRWDFDEFVEEVIVKEDSKGNDIEIKTGRKVSTFPPTPENIADKRKELIQAAIENGDDIDKAKINVLTSPRTLRNHDEMEAALDKGPAWQELVRRLTKLSR